RLQELRNHPLWMSRLEAANGIRERRTNFLAPWKTIPRSIDPFERILLGGLSRHGFEVDLRWTRIPHCAGALAVMHAAAKPARFLVRMAGDGFGRPWVGAARRDGRRFRRSLRIGSPLAAITPGAAPLRATGGYASIGRPDQPVCLPRLYVLQL